MVRTCSLLVAFAAICCSQAGPARRPEDAAALDEIRKSYARLDEAYSTGNVELLESISTPDVKFGSLTQKVSLRENMAEIQAAARAGAQLAFPTEVKCIELAGNEAKVGTRPVITMTRDGATTAYEGTGSDTWVRVEGAWRLKESILLSVREVLPPTGPETVRAVVAELRKQVRPLTTVEAGNSFADLEPFGRAVGDARLVALGEATHGTREIFQMKHRLLEYLVKEKGFTVFAIEANWPESEAADRYIKTGEGDPKAALRAMYFWTWQTEEVLAMLEWMRNFNKGPGKHPMLSFTSFDMQAYDVARDRVLAWTKQYAPEELAKVEVAYAGLASLKPWVRTDPAFEEAAQKADNVVRLLEAQPDTFAKASSAKAFREVLQMARIVEQATRMHTVGAGGSYRDQVMARNVEWLLKEAYPNEKIVLWAHNGHVATARSTNDGPMGGWLRESLGTKMYVLGFAIHTGSVRASTREGGRRIGLAESRIPPAEAGTGTATLSAAGQPLFFLDLRNLTGALGKWLSERHLYRDFGATWDRDRPQSMLVYEIGKSYDGLIYLEDTHAARGL